MAKTKQATLPREAVQRLNQELAKQGIKIVESPFIRTKKIHQRPKPVSIQSVQGAIEHELKKLRLEIVGRPEFQPAGNFTLAQVKVRRRQRGRQSLIVGTGVSKRNCLDDANNGLGQALALQRALFGQHTQKCLATGKAEKANGCKCLSRWPTSVAAKLKVD